MLHVSVIMPVYNAQRYVGKAVESILGQTCGDFEFIIVDDGSTDGTPDVLAEFTDSRIRIIRQDNAGSADAANTALGAAQCELIARMDADDIAYPERFEREVAYMRRHADCIALGTAIRAICPEGLPLYERCPPVDHDNIAAALWAGDGQGIIHPTLMTRRRGLARIGGYRRRFRAAQDLDLYLRLHAYGRFANLPEPLVGYRQHPESVSSTQPDRQMQLVSEMLEELADQCPIPGYRPDYRGFTPEPLHEAKRRWGWNALKHGRPELARGYAWAALRDRPLSPDNWRLAYCAVRGR